MLYFRSEEHIDRWCNTWRMERGGVMTPEQGWQLAVEWYGPDRRAPEWRRKTVDEVEKVFSEIGLTSPFWNLKMTHRHSEMTRSQFEITASDLK